MQLSRMINKDNIWHYMSGKALIEDLEGKQQFEGIKLILSELKELGEQERCSYFSILGGTLRYLEGLLKLESVIGALQVCWWQGGSSMILDSEALAHLEVFETAGGESERQKREESRGTEGSLFQRMDFTCTKFGRRLFRRWISRPLKDPLKINSRLDAVDDLIQASYERDALAKSLRKLPDLQKIANRLFLYASKSLSKKAIYFADVNSLKLRQFKDFISHIETAWEILTILSKKKSSFNSQRLIKLLTLVADKFECTNSEVDGIWYEDEEPKGSQVREGIMPNIEKEVKQMKSYIIWEGDNPLPKPGLLDGYDKVKERIANINKDLEVYLTKIRVEMKEPRINYVHIKERFELEIPEASEKRRGSDFIFTSRRAGFSRYTTSRTRELVLELETLEEELKKQLSVFVEFFFEQFKTQRYSWETFINILAEIDCLQSLSKYAETLHLSCRPKFTPNSFLLEDAIHPCLDPLRTIPNSLNLSQKRTLLLTGPNMGGKSTLLRTICLISIMAQIGSYVPAKNYEVPVLDRIFTRIGATDRLTLGKSTFFIEMEEAKTVIEYASGNSLVIMDELGRGTSTFDGMAIAHSILSEMVDKINCFCLFSTHYHHLAEEYSEPGELLLRYGELSGSQSTKKMLSRWNEKVQLGKMLCEVVEDLNGEKKIIFAYKVGPGTAQKSFGMNVARVVGLPSQLIKLAEIKADQMDQEINKKIEQTFTWILKTVT